MEEKIKIPPQAGRYRCLVVDPPWDQGKFIKRDCRPNQGTELSYKTMTPSEIGVKLPINEWAAENAFLWLWATNSRSRSTKRPILEEAFALIDWWGFRYYTLLTWDKKTGVCPFSPYQVTTEHVLFAFKGKANFPKESMGKMKTLFTSSESRKNAHSVKPIELYQHIEKYFEAPRLDVFARRKHKGFDGWGDEYEGNGRRADS